MMFLKRLGTAFLALIMVIASFSLTTAMAEGTVITLNVTNTPVRGDVLLKKTGLQLVRFEDEEDAYGNTVMKPVYQNGYLAGSVFELHAAENIVGKEGTAFYQKDALIETLTTSGSGTVKSGVLPLGKYYLIETSAPEGYVFSSEPYHFTLAAADQKTAVVEVTVSAANTYLPIKVYLTKQKEALKVTEADGMVHQTVERVAGDGFVFGLYNSEVIAYGNDQKLPANTLLATAATNSQGKLIFSGYYPHGSYYIKELSGPAGWRIGSQKYPVSLTADNKASTEDCIVITLTEPILNELIYTPVTITKTDITGAEKLPGALIEITDADSNVVYREYTDENGEIPDIPVVPGTYTFRETYAPEGYALNVAQKTFTVTEDGKVTGDTVIKDEINRVLLKKTRENGDPLSGAVFGLFDKDDKQVQTAASNDEGVVSFSKIGYGSYTIREIQPPYGYHGSTEEWRIEIDGTYLNTVEYLATVSNADAPGRIQVTKLDALDNHPIAGVQFDIYTADEQGAAGDLIGTMTTNENGVAESGDLFAADYIVLEHANPEGYENELWNEKLTVPMDETVKRTVTNMPVQGRIRIVKTDSETEKPLPGAEFTVTRVSGLPSHNGEGNDEIVAVITSNEDGIAETEMLTWGTYTVSETRVPDDYLDDEYSVTVTIPESAH